MTHNKMIIWIAVLLLLAVGASAQVPDGGVFFYKFSGDYTDSWNSNDGTNNGAAFNNNFPSFNVSGDGQPNSTTYQGGNGDYVDANTPLNTQDFSASIWFKQNDTGSTMTMVSWEDSDNSERFNLRRDSNNQIDMFIKKSSSTSCSMDTSETYTDGNWHHVIAVVSVSNNCTLYVDGVHRVNTSDTAGSMSLDSTPIRVGTAHTNPTVVGWTGELDSAKFFNRTLTATEVKNLYNYGDINGDSPTQENFTITAQDLYDSSSLSNFSAIIEGDSNYTTTNGTITTGILSNSTQLWNITITSDQDGGYFNRTYTDQNVSSDLTASLHQSELLLSAEEKVTGVTLSGGNFSAPSQTVDNGEPLKLKAATYDITYKKAGYFDQIQSFTLNNLENTTGTITRVYETNATFNISDIRTGAQVTNFTEITLSNEDGHSYTETLNTTTGKVAFNIVQGNYSVYTDAEGYAIDNSTIEVTSTGQVTYQVQLYTTNSIDISFRDEETEALIDFETVSFELISDLFSANYTTSNGSLYVDLLTPETYTMRYSSPSYPERFYLFTLDNRTTKNLTLYLLNSSSLTEITATVYDETNDLLEGAVIKVLRYYIDCNCYKTQEILETNFEGKATFNTVLNDEFYKFILEFPQGTVRQETSQTQLYETTITFQILTGDSVATKFYTTQGISHSLSFTDSTNNFRFTWSDSANTVTQLCMDIYQIRTTSTTLINQTCSNSAAGTIIINVDNSTGNIFKAETYATIDGENIPLDSLIKSFEDANALGNYGLWLVWILVVIFALSAVFNPSVAAFITPIPLLLGKLAGLIYMNWGILLTLQVAGIIIAYMMSDSA